MNLGSNKTRQKLFYDKSNLSSEVFHNSTLHIGDVISLYTEDRSRQSDDRNDDRTFIKTGFLSTLG